MMETQKSFEPKDKGSLYLVPTPIGNLEDMTFRAIRLLKEVDLIAAEDTRNTQKLLNHFDITTPQISYHDHNVKERTEQLIQKLVDGQTIAQVSDAGMPSISDPGVELVKAAIEAGISVIPLPGANAALTALIASGLAPQPFYFYGFLPRKKNDLKQALNDLNKREETLIFYESPHRLKQVIGEMRAIFGYDRQVVLAREVTKRFEEFIRGNLEEISEWTLSEQVRGEFVIVVEGNAHVVEEGNPEWEKWSVKEHVEHLMEEKNVSSKEAIKEVAISRDLPKREIYSAYHQLDEH